MLDVEKDRLEISRGSTSEAGELVQTVSVSLCEALAAAITSQCNLCMGDACGHADGDYDDMKIWLTDVAGVTVPVQPFGASPELEAALLDSATVDAILALIG